MSSRINVAIPWNLPCYIPANGFHPLYEALFDGETGLDFHCFDEVALAAQLQSNPQCYRDFEARRYRILQERPCASTAAAIGQRLFDWVSASSLAAMEQIPGGLELHHTAPLGMGRRPFVLHCESFLPTFAPFFAQGKSDLPSAAAVREYYAPIFRADNCLGIFSHLQSTLDQIARFFQDALIDTKLALTPIGLPDAKLDALLGWNRRERAARPCFLFTNSAHQQAASFVKRGGIASLLFAARLLETVPAARFVFRFGRPEAKELAEFPVAAAMLDHPSVAWIKDYLPDQRQLELFLDADFLLLPSLNLHSVSIIQAMASGAIPVVSDTQGPEHYVTDGRTGIVVRGVREALWRDDAATGVPVDDHRVAASLQTRIADQMLDKVGGLLAAPEGMARMRERMRAEVRARFRGAKFREHMAEEIARRWSAYRAGRNVAPTAPAPMPPERFPGTDRWRALFASPPAPVTLLERADVRLIACKGAFYRFRAAAGIDHSALFPYALYEKGLLQRSKARIGADREAFGRGIFMRRYGITFVEGFTYGLARRRERVRQSYRGLKHWHRRARDVLRRRTLDDEFVRWLAYASPGTLRPGNAWSMDYAIRHLPSGHPLVETGSFSGLATNVICHLLRKYRRSNVLFTCENWDVTGQQSEGAIGASALTFPEYARFVKASFLRSVNFFSPQNRPYTVEAPAAAFCESWERCESVTDVFGREARLGGPISFCYVDGLHCREAVRKEFESVGRCLDPGGFILFNDSSDGSPFGLAGVMREIAASGRYDLVAQNPNYLFRKR